MTTTKSPIEHIQNIAGELPFNFGTLLVPILENPKFPTWSGSSEVGQHHYGTGGLAIHTSEVAMLCVSNARIFMAMGVAIDLKVLFLAAVYHDYGKIWDYMETGDPIKPWGAAPHKRTVHHIARSAIEWVNIARGLNVDKDTEEAVLHCILSHHAEYRSTVLPKSKEAWILHLSDNMSARVSDCGTHDLAKHT